MTDIFINKSIWNQFSTEQMAAYEDTVFRYYREHGFPYFDTSKEFRESEFRKLMNYESELIVDDTVKQTMHGLALAWSYMPHSWSIQCNDMRTVMDVFNDDELFKQVIKKRIRMGDNISDNGIRKMLKMFTGTQAVSNFRPTAAYALYNRYAPVGGNVLDMSMGFGGRLLGAIKAKVNYIGFDPSTPTVRGLANLAIDFGGSIHTALNKLGSEFIDLPKNSIDFAFTSPPYYDTEKYTTEPTQSYMKYRTRNEWLVDYLGATFYNVRECLVDGGYMAINIANAKSYSNLEHDAVKMALMNGFVLDHTLKLSLSNSSFVAGKSAFKYEPIFVFKKL